MLQKCCRMDTTLASLVERVEKPTAQRTRGAATISTQAQSLGSERIPDWGAPQLHDDRTPGLPVARHANRPLPGFFRPAAGESDRARRGDLLAPPPRSLAVLAVRLPGRRMRLVRHDRQRPAALDVAHPRVPGGSKRPAPNLPPGKFSRDQRPRHRYERLFREMAGCPRRLRPDQDAPR